MQSLQSADPDRQIAFGDATRVWAEVALKSFGGPAGQIAVMHRILVEERRWVSEGRFLHALNYCMLLPGPEAQQLATYIGWLLHGYRGGIVAGTLFVLPGFVAILALSLLYIGFKNVALVDALLYGVKAAVLAVVVEALLRIAKKVLRNGAMTAIAVCAFIGIFVFEVPFPLIVLGAGVIGYVGGKVRPRTFVVLKAHQGKAGGAVDEMLEANAKTRIAPSLRRALRDALICGVLWALPLVIIALTLGRESVLFREGVFFSKAAVVTFGGAYAVLAYIAQQAVERYGWLRAEEMLDGLGMAETTPGPLIMVVQFVAFLGAYRDPGVLTPLAAAVAASVVTTWVTFVPCFLWIFLGAPYIEALRGNRELTAALSAITAAVVGVIANLAVWFALHVVFGKVDEILGPLGTRWFVPDLASVEFAALIIAAGAMIAMLRFHVSLARVLLVSAAVGVAQRLLLAR
jgi:chromate transporter